MIEVYSPLGIWHVFLYSINTNVWIAWQAGLNLTCLETRETGLHPPRPIWQAWILWLTLSKDYKRFV